MAEKTFLTGATGFVGSAVVRKLVAKGHQVHVLSRPNNNRHNLEGLEIEIVEGDLTKPETYRNSLKDCRNLFHVAADYRIWVPNPDAMNKVNVDGTRALMVAALDAGVKRIVYTSSVATLGSTADGKPATEDTPVSFSNMIGPYKKSKFLAEQEVMRMIQHQQLPAVIVNPSTPVGPRDIKPTPTGRIVINALNGMIPAYVNTGLNVVHVDDVATGHLLALEQGKVGERYILGGTDMELREILAAIAKIAGHSPPKIKLPIKALYPVAYCMELTARYTGREPMLTRDSLEMAKKKMYFSSAKAEKELGYTFRPAEEAIADAITWFQAEWYC
jgi:dihydroflavonol-4-reductase